MKRRLTIFILCVGCLIAANAQNTFTENLQKSKAGEGKITVTQDESIEALVNAPATTTSSRNSQATPDKSQANPSATTPEKKDDLTTLPGDTTTPDTTMSDARRKIMRGGYKVNGFRVQVFAGGNSRNDRVKAERTGEEIKSLFPLEPVYVHFYSPRWICRMGNYRTYEEAYEILRNVKRLGYNSATIVKGKIIVPYL